MLTRIMIFVHINAMLATAALLPQSELSFSKCIQSVGRKHFVGNSTIIVLPKLSDPISDSILKGLHEVYSVIIFDRQSKHTSTSSTAMLIKPDNILFYVSGQMELEQSIQYLKKIELWNPLAPILVVLNQNLTRQSSLVAGKVKKLFRIFKKENSIKIYLMSFDGHKKFEIFSWFSTNNEIDCSKSVDVGLMGECLNDGDETNGKFIMKTEYRDLPIKLKQCPLALIALKKEPYIICNGKNICDNGIEIRLFQTVAESLNLKLKIEVVEKIDDFVYKKLLQRKSDLLIGGINSIAARHRNLKQSVTYFQDELTWCVPVAASIHPWLTMFLIMDEMQWICFMIVNFCAGGALYFLYRFHHHQKNYWFCAGITVVILTSMPVPIEPRKTLFRCIFAIYLICGLLWSSTFKAFHLSFITHSIRANQIATQLQLMQHSMELYAENETMVVYRHTEGEVSKYILENFRSCLGASCLEKFLNASTNDVAVATTKLNSRKHPNVFCFLKPENIYDFPVTSVAHEHFHLMDSINSKIQNIIEAGLISKWKRDGEPTTTDVNEGLIVFSIQHIGGSIVICIVGYGVALITFVVEKYLHSKLKSSIKPSFSRLCERIFYTEERDGFQEFIRYCRWIKSKKM